MNSLYELLCKRVFDLVHCVSKRRLRIAMFFILAEAFSMVSQGNTLCGARPTSTDGIELAVNGYATDPDGVAIESGVVLVYQNGRQLRESEIANGRFSFVTSGDSRVSVWLKSWDGQFQASHDIEDYEMREFAQQEWRVPLGPPRSILVRATDDDSTVAGANVILSFRGISLFERTDATGEVSFEIPSDNDGRLSVCAWTDDRRIAGEYSYQARKIDFASNLYELELMTGSPLQVRVVDQDHQPVSMTPIEIRVALQLDQHSDGHTFIPDNPTCIAVTDFEGLAVFDCVPSWDARHTYIVDDQNRTLEKLRTDEGTDVIVVTKRDDDRLVDYAGEVSFGDRMVRGMLIQGIAYRIRDGETKVWSFKSRLDEEGRFKAKVIPGVVYCVCANDLAWVSNTWEGILVEESSLALNPIELTITAGTSVLIKVTQGSDAQPVAGSRILIRAEHKFSIGPDGEMGEGGRQWWLKTNQSGQAEIRAIPGQHKVMLYHEDWVELKEIEISPDQIQEIHFHRN